MALDVTEVVILLLGWWALGWLMYRKYPLGIRDAVQGGRAFMLRRYGEAELDRVPGRNRREKLAHLRENPDAGVARGSTELDRARGYQWGALTLFGTMLICYVAFPDMRLMTGPALVIMTLGVLIAGGWHALNGR